MKTLDFVRVKESGFGKKRDVATLQTAIYVMCGGGMLGRMAAEQPEDFYIDDRCGRLPYTRKEILQAVQVLCTLAKKSGIDTRNMPPLADFHNCGIF